LKKGEIDTWLTLEQAKHGLVHLRLTWMQLSSEKNDLKAALAETQMLRVTDMSTALLTVFIDSARNLPVEKRACLNYLERIINGVYPFSMHVKEPTPILI
jgi:hypothetical protein